MSSRPALAVIVVSYNSAEVLPALLDAVGSQLGYEDELVVVDNASSDNSARVARQYPPTRVIESGVNGGFAAGCHIGARATSAPLLLFLNPDSVPAPECLDRLAEAAASQPDWAAWQAAVLTTNGEINTDGGVVHFTGIGWAGNCGQPAAGLPSLPRHVAFPSGAALVIRRAAWDELGGLDSEYFLYSEDLDLGLRLWLAGYEAGMVPDAHVMHDYEFSKGLEKWFWLERNRWTTILSVYPAALLVVLAPALLATELALLFVAAADGWLTVKLRAQAATVRGLKSTLRRRRRVQLQRRISTAEFAQLLTASLDSPYLPVQHISWAVRAQAAYWLLARRLISRRGDAPLGS